MYFESKIFSVIAKIFSLPPIIAGGLIMANIPESFAWGVFTLTIGLAVFGYKHTLTIDKDQLKTTVGIYQLVLKTKHIKMTEFSNIHLGAGSVTNGAGHVSSAPFRLSFSYKYPDNYMSGDSYKPKGFGVSAFTKFNLHKWNQNNFDNLSNDIIKKISDLTSLPIIYSKKVERDFIHR